jgi:hypothetical protein
MKVKDTVELMQRLQMEQQRREEEQRVEEERRVFYSGLIARFDLAEALQRFKAPTDEDIEALVMESHAREAAIKIASTPTRTLARSPSPKRNRSPSPTDPGKAGAGDRGDASQVAKAGAAMAMTSTASPARPQLLTPEPRMHHPSPSPGQGHPGQGHPHPGAPHAAPRPKIGVEALLDANDYPGWDPASQARVFAPTATTTRGMKAAAGRLQPLQRRPVMKWTGEGDDLALIAKLRSAAVGRSADSTFGQNAHGSPVTANPAAGSPVAGANAKLFETPSPLARPGSGKAMMMNGSSGKATHTQPQRVLSPPRARSSLSYFDSPIGSGDAHFPEEEKLGGGGDRGGDRGGGGRSGGSGAGGGGRIFAASPGLPGRIPMGAKRNILSAKVKSAAYPHSRIAERRLDASPGSFAGQAKP